MSIDLGPTRSDDPRVRELVRKHLEEHQKALSFLALHEDNLKDLATPIAETMAHIMWRTRGVTPIRADLNGIRFSVTGYTYSSRRAMHRSPELLVPFSYLTSDSWEAEFVRSHA